MSRLRSLVGRRRGARAALVGLATVAGLLAGAGVTVAVQGAADPSEPGGAPAAVHVPGALAGGGEPGVDDGGADGPAKVVTDEEGTDAGGTDGPAADGPGTGAGGADRLAAGEVLLAWSPGRLAPELVAGAAAHPDVTGVSVGRAGVVDLAGSRTADGRAVDAHDPGWAVPLDAVALDPAAHVAFVGVADRAALTGLDDGEALLGQTSAGLRRLGPGGTLVLTGGTELTVTAVVDDATIGGAELAVTVATGERIGVGTPRYLLARHTAGARSAVESSLRRAVVAPVDAVGDAGGADAGVPVRFRAPGETPFLRHGDAVLTPAQLKDRFGEFAYRRAPDGRMFADHDADWRSEHVVRREVPILGVVECHRNILDALAGALGELEAAGLADLVRPDEYAGCWVPRLVREGAAVSHHAWGVALDLNWDHNPSGAESRQDDRVIEVFARWGFTWGGDWLEPDPAHLEYIGPPTPGHARTQPGTRR